MSWVAHISLPKHPFAVGGRVPIPLGGRGGTSLGGGIVEVRCEGCCTVDIRYHGGWGSRGSGGVRNGHVIHNAGTVLGAYAAWRTRGVGVHGDARCVP